MNATQVQALATIRASLPPDLAQIWESAHLTDALAPQPEPDDAADPDDDAGPFDDPQTLAGFQAWRATGLRTYNLYEAEALALAFDQPRSFGVLCSAWAWRLNGSGTRDGWWCKTAPTHADDLGCSVEQFRRVQNAMVDGRFVRRKVGRNNVTEYRLNHDALNALSHAHGEAMGVDFKGLAARFEGNPQTVKQTREKFHGLRETPRRFEGNPQTGIQGKEIEKPPAGPSDTATQHDGTREPGEDDEETGTSNPPAPASLDGEADAVTDVLIRACDTKGIPHKAGEIAAFVTLRDVTPAEAAHAAGVIRNATDPIDRLNYVKSVIENYRAQGRKRDFATPVGGHADPAQTRRVLADLDRARQHRLPDDEQQRHMDDMRAALASKCKALSKEN
jgi:hypothetical protein